MDAGLNALASSTMESKFRGGLSRIGLSESIDVSSHDRSAAGVFALGVLEAMEPHELRKSIAEFESLLEADGTNFFSTFIAAGQLGDYFSDSEAKYRLNDLGIQFDRSSAPLLEGGRRVRGFRTTPLVAALQRTSVALMMVDRDEHLSFTGRLIAGYPAARSLDIQRRRSRCCSGRGRHSFTGRTSVASMIGRCEIASRPQKGCGRAVLWPAKSTDVPRQRCRRLPSRVSRGRGGDGREVGTRSLAEFCFHWPGQ